MAQAELPLLTGSASSESGTEPRFLGTPLSIVLLRTWGGLGIALAIVTLIHPSAHTVFPIYARGSFRWWHDLSLYVTFTDMDLYRYSPTFAIVTSPITLLGHTVGGILWHWLCLGVLLLGLYRAEKVLLPGQRTAWGRTIFLLLSILLALTGLWNNQCNALIVGMMLLGSCALARGQWWSSAAWLGGAVVLKLTILPIILLISALYPRQVGWRIMIVVLIGAIIPFLTRPPSIVIFQYQAWHQQMKQTSTQRWPGFRDAWLVWQIFEHRVLLGKAGKPDLEARFHSSVYRGIQFLSAFLVLLWCAWIHRKHKDVRWSLTFLLSMGCAWSMLFGPATEHPTYVFLAPFLAWAFVERARWPRWKWLLTLSSVLVFVLGWRALTVHWWQSFPWFLTALPLGTSLFMGWLFFTGGDPKRAKLAKPEVIHFS